MIKSWWNAYYFWPFVSPLTSSVPGPVHGSFYLLRESSAFAGRGLASRCAHTLLCTLLLWLCFAGIYRAVVRAKLPSSPLVFCSRTSSVAHHAQPHTLISISLEMSLWLLLRSHRNTHKKFENCYVPWIAFLNSDSYLFKCSESFQWQLSEGTVHFKHDNNWSYR